MSSSKKLYGALNLLTELRPVYGTATYDSAFERTDDRASQACGLGR